MLSNDSAVLPAAVPALKSNEGDEYVFDTNEFNNLSRSRPSRPYQDDGWLDTDHYFEDDAPTDSFNSSKWKEKYKDMDEIQVNGAIKRQWMRGKKEVEQILARCKHVIGRDRL